jgi:hypothetical protein
MSGGSSENCEYNNIFIVKSELDNQQLTACYEPILSQCNDRFPGEATNIRIYTLPEFLDFYPSSHEEEIDHAIENIMRDTDTPEKLRLIRLMKYGRGIFFN